MDQQSLRADPSVALQIEFNDPRAGLSYSVSVTPFELFSVHQALKTLGSAQTTALIALGALIGLDGNDVQARHYHMIEVTILTLQDILKGSIDHREQFMLDISYRLLSSAEKRLTRAEIAEFASDVLGEAISADAWRKRVDRWAEREHMPKVEQIRRRKKPTL